MKRGAIRSSIASGSSEARAPIVFLHGFGADLNCWRPGHRVLPERRPALAIDLPGHGLSPLGEDASFEALVEAAREALIGEGLSATHLVGHSLGGAVAVALSRGVSVKALSLMLIAPAGLGEETGAAFFEGFLQADTEAALTP
jgi:pyruvate dehydrogenase E2 component (dihydrolipoamide acetyltransferase)